MKKKVVFLLLVTAVLLTLFTGCTTQPESEGFAIYLTRDDVPPSQMEALSYVALAADPIISMDDIIYYLPGTHEIELTDAAYQKLEAMHFPTYGTSFMVCVDGQPIYWGAFWPYYSSMSFDGVIIAAAPFLHPTENLPNAIQIRLGYPASSFFTGEDPRSNPIIFEVLEEAGKLVSA